jgi:tetratricopeptide (TPR) repeat protein
MKARWFAIAVLVACAFVLSAAPDSEAKDQWFSLRSKNFNIVANSDERSTRELALKLEQFRFVFLQLFNIKNDSPVPITVVVFKSDDSFKPFKPLYNGKPANVAGYFQRGEDENIIALNINGNEQRPMSVIFHEYTHLLTAYTPHEWPLWLKEGLAELYSTFDVKKNEVTIGSPISHHVYFLRAQKFTPLERMFQVSRYSPDYNERSKQGVFYAESWALTHYLMFGNKSARQPELLEFVKLINSGATVEKAFAGAFKSDYASIEKDLRRYIGNDSYAATIYTMKSVEGEKDLASRPLSDAEVQFYLGDLLFHTNRVDEAEKFFTQASTLDPALPGPYEGLGFVATRRNKYAEAAQQFKEASARGSKNHLAHFYYAQSMVQDASLSGALQNRSDLVKAIADELKISIKLMPGFAPAYHLLGFTYLVSGEDLKQAAEALTAALQLEPQNQQFALTMAHIQVRAQNYAAARKTLATLLASDDPTVKASADSIANMIESLAGSPNQNRPPAPFRESVGISPDVNEGRRPVLKRREESKDNSGDSASPADLSKEFAGLESISGELAAIECGNGSMVLAFKTPSKLLRFAVTDPVKLQFTSKDPAVSARIQCGPVNLPAILKYKPPISGKSDFAGDAVSVELKP